MEASIVVSVVSLLASLSSIMFAFLSFRRSDRKDRRVEGKFEGEVASGLAHIKEMLSKMETDIAKLDSQSRELAERMARVEESYVRDRKGGQ